MCLSGISGVSGSGWLCFARKISCSLDWLDVTLSKQRPLGGVINFMCSEVGGLMLFLFVHSNLYTAVDVCRVNSWITLLSPFPELPDTRVQKLGEWQLTQGEACLQIVQFLE